jgi:hypothetical protein
MGRYWSSDYNYYSFASGAHFGLEATIEALASPVIAPCQLKLSINMGSQYAFLAHHTDPTALFKVPQNAKALSLTHEYWPITVTEKGCELGLFFQTYGTRIKASPLNPPG